MKFLVDAQLPARLARVLADAGHDVVHTSTLPNQNRTSDAEIARLADAEDRVVVSKDRDFRDSHLLRSSPAGSSSWPPATSPTTLCWRCSPNLDAVVGALDEASFVELGHDRLVVHDDR